MASPETATASDLAATAKPDWCDIHHKDHWAEGGVTSVESGELRCRYHHTKEHIRQALTRLKQRRRS